MLITTLNVRMDHIQFIVSITLINVISDYANDDSIITIKSYNHLGSVNSKETLYTDSGRYETTLKNFKITPSNNDTITYNGSIISKYSYNNAQYQIKKMTFNVFDNETKESNQLIANNYQLNVNKLTVTSQGNVEGNPDNKIFREFQK